MTYEDRINELMCLSKADLARMLAEMEPADSVPAAAPFEPNAEVAPALPQA